MRVSVVASRLGDPMRSRYRDRNIDGRFDNASSQRDNFAGDSEPFLNNMRSKSDNAPAANVPYFMFLIVCAFCCAARL